LTHDFAHSFEQITQKGGSPKILFSTCKEAIHVVHSALFELLATELSKLTLPRRQALNCIIENYRILLNRCSITSAVLRAECERHKRILKRLHQKLTLKLSIEEDKLNLEDSQKSLDELHSLHDAFEKLITLISNEEKELIKMKEEAIKRRNIFIGIAVVAGLFVVASGVVAAVVLSGGTAMAPLVAGVAITTEAAVTTASTIGAGSVVALVTALVAAAGCIGVISATSAAVAVVSDIQQSTESLQKFYSNAKSGCKTLNFQITELFVMVNKAVQDKESINDHQMIDDLIEAVSNCIKSQKQFVEDLNKFDSEITKNKEEYLQDLLKIQVELEKPPVDRCILL